MGKGVYRDGDTAYVEYGKPTHIPMSREMYEANRYQPFFFSLPEKADRAAANE